LKKSKTSHLDCRCHIEGDIMQNHEKNQKKLKNQDSMGKTNFFLSTMPFSPWAVLATCSSSENTREINLKPILNETSQWAHTKSELSMLGVARNAWCC
jgi:hypothetical protein